MRRTADGVLVLFHDPTISIPGKGKVSIARANVADLANPDGSRLVATFSEALQATAGTGTRLLLDLKRPGDIAPEQIVTIVRQHAALDRIIIGARTAAEVRAYRRLSSSLPILGLVETQADIDPVIAAGATIIRLWPKWIFDPRSGCDGTIGPACIVHKLQVRGVHVWALADGLAHEQDTSACFAALARLKLDGLLTNRPLLAPQAMAEDDRDDVTNRRRCD